MDGFQSTPGRLYVVGTLLPLMSFAVLLVAGGLRALCRPFRQQGGTAASVYWALGGDTPARGGAIFATVFMGLAAVIGIAGLVLFLTDSTTGAEHAARWSARADWLRLGPVESAAPPAWEERWREWKRQQDASSGRELPEPTAPPTALALEIGYKIDHLTAVVFAMVTLIGTLIFVFSLGYMRDETKEVVEDHTLTPDVSPASAEAGPSHFHRRGRYGRFFLYLSLFCFSMLNLVIADNLFQVFVSWELVGVCSFFLIGFYYERPSAARAANKAFIVNRVGDAGFLVGILIAWTYLGTLNFEEMQRRVRCPAKDAHSAPKVEFANQFVRVDISGERDEAGNPQLALPPKGQGGGTHLALFPVSQVGHFDALGHTGHRGEPRSLPPKQTYTDFGAIPYWLFVAMGIGIFLGCAGKSAQVPLQTWLPDAMEGPTPVSALIHAATMVAAGVYLVGRCHPLFCTQR